MNIENLLLKVENPARYVGGEFNEADFKKNAALNFCLCFCDVYEVGMSNMGIKILYGLLNSLKAVNAELCFTPWTDLANLLQQQKIPLFSLATKMPLNKFDMLGFSIASELNYTNALYMLELAGLELESIKRKATDPIVIAGGMGCLSPLAISPFFDLLVVGEGEEVTEKLASLYKEIKKTTKQKVKIKTEFLEKASEIDGVFVPSIHLGKLKTNKDFKIKRALVKDLDKVFFATKFPISNVEAVHHRANIELFRGCLHGCRFCQAGFVGRPMRSKSPQTLLSQAKELILSCGYSELGLSSLSTCDYKDLENLVKKLKPLCDKHRVKLSLPSTRIDSFLTHHAEESRKSSITFAPEAATQRLRDVINKNISDEEITRGLSNAFSQGYSAVKLYFMIGLPTERQEDIDAIIVLAKQVKWLYRQHASNKKPLSLTVSASTFVPKPFTPFAWEAQVSLEKIKEVQFKLKLELNKMGVKFSFHDKFTSKLEAALARGGLELVPVILQAYKDGAKFDAWSEKFDFTIWQNSFIKNGIDLEKATSELDTGKQQAWEIVDSGIEKRFLLSERQNALFEKVSPNCSKKCLACGANKFSKFKCTVANTPNDNM